MFNILRASKIQRGFRGSFLKEVTSYITHARTGNVVRYGTILKIPLTISKTNELKIVAQFVILRITDHILTFKKVKQ